MRNLTYVPFVGRHPLITVVLVFCQFILMPIILSIVVPLVGFPRVWIAYLYLLSLGSLYLGLTVTERRARSRITFHSRSPQDERVFEEAHELLTQLKLEKAKILDMHWSGPTNQCSLANDTLLLPRRFRSNLQTDDWKTLIASTLLFYHNRRIQLRYALAVLEFLVGPLFLLMAILAFVGPIIEPRSLASLIFVVFLVLSPFIIMIGGGYLLSRAIRRVWLESDKMACSFVGRDYFLQVLKKIDEMNIAGEKRRENRWEYLAGSTTNAWRPIIAERIENLERMNSQ